MKKFTKLEDVLQFQTYPLSYIADAGHLTIKTKQDRLTKIYTPSHNWRHFKTVTLTLLAGFDY